MISLLKYLKTTSEFLTGYEEPSRMKKVLNKEMSVWHS